MPRSRTRPTVATSIVSPSMTARTSTGSERRRAVAVVDTPHDKLETIAGTQPAMASRNFIAISSGTQNTKS
jgi:hypothetical protein